MWFTLIREAVLVFTALGAVAVVASDLTPEDVRAMLLDSSGSLINNTERQEMLGDVAVVASELIPDPEDVRAMVLDTSESLINNTERESLGEVAVVASELTPDREDVRAMVLDSSGSLINNTERMTEEEIDYDYWNSVEERGDWNCSLPNTGFTCGRAGGYCVRYNNDCDGILDVGGCRGKKCKCCLPEQTTPAPCTCPPCSTTVATTPIPTTTEAPTTTLIPTTTETPTTTPIPTTTAHGCLPPWVSVGNGSVCLLFVLNNTMDWNSSRTNCQSEGGDLAILDTESKRNATVQYCKSSGLVNSIDFWDNAFWLAANDRSGSWKWLNGNSVIDGWESSQPNEDAGDNTCIYANIKQYEILYDFTCASSSQIPNFICEKEVLEE